MDYSLYEKKNPRRMARSNGIALGRITKVYAEERMCEVKTFMGGNPDLNDNHIPKAQWLSTDGHPDGDESGFIPRVNSYCLVFFVQGEPFIWGFISPLSTKGTTVDDDKEKEELFDGDRVFKTAAGNKIILRAHGEIQVESTPICRSIYFPDDHRLNTLVRNYEFRCDGGTLDWVDLDPDLETTYFRQEYRDDTQRTNVFVEEYGSMADDTTFMYRRELGQGDPEDPESIVDTCWTNTVDVDGEEHKHIRVPGGESGVDVRVKPDGNIEIDVNNKLNLKILPNGTTELDIGPNNVNLKMTNDGVTTLNSTGAKLKFANKKLEIGQDSIQLLAKIIEELGNIITFTKQAKEHVHEANLGYLSLRPSDQTPWEKMISSTEKIKADITTLKGDL